MEWVETLSVEKQLFIFTVQYQWVLQLKSGALQ